jgi:hypothetical protein
MGRAFADSTSVGGDEPATSNPQPANRAMTSITVFTVQPDELPRVVQNLRDRLEGQTYFNFSISAGIVSANGVIEISADCDEDDKAEATSMAVTVLANSFA